MRHLVTKLQRKTSIYKKKLTLLLLEFRASIYVNFLGEIQSSESAIMLSRVSKYCKFRQNGHLLQ